jgi:hypothetical protein
MIFPLVVENDGKTRMKIDFRASTGKNPSSEACVLLPPMAASERQIAGVERGRQNLRFEI